MSSEILTLHQGSIRGTDSNSLLRLYDLVSQTISKSLLLHERERAQRTLQRIAKELRKRNVPL
jgi:hypothetical protein